MRKTIIYLIIFLLVLFTISGEEQDPDKGKLSFSMGLGIGGSTFNEDEGPVNYTAFSFYPDFGIGKFGIGLDLTINTILGTDGEIRGEDWVLDSDNSFVDVYLPKIRYIRYGKKGDDLFIKLGTIDDATLGNGFIMQNYSNALFLPETRLFGLNFDLDGNLFDFPYIGIETFVGNVAVFDVVAARLFVRPLITQDMPILKNLEVGMTVAADTSAYEYLEDEYKTLNSLEDPDTITIIGADVRLPIIVDKPVTLAAYGDIVSQDSKTSGGMIGAGGSIVKIIPYNLQIRILGDNFIPTYFDMSYDLFREQKYDIISGNTDSPGFVGWLFSTGLAFENIFALIITLDGPFNKPSSDPDNYLNYTHLLGTFTTAEIANFSFMAYYDKKLIRGLNDLTDPNDALIGAKLNYQMDSVMISFVYTLRYNPDALSGESNWETTSGVQTTISF